MSGESLLEQERRLLAMAEDDGDTWDLSDNDRAACRAGAKAMEAARFKILKSLARSREQPPGDVEGRGEGGDVLGDGHGTVKTDRRDD